MRQSQSCWAFLVLTCGLAGQLHTNASGATCTDSLFNTSSYFAGAGPKSVAVGDLDGVNGPDLAVANIGSDDVSVLLNQGDGTFAPAVAYDVGTAPTSVAIGDLDGVNGPDLAVVYEGAPGTGCPVGFFDSHVSVLLNQGDGTFAAPTAYTAGDGSSFVAIGDLDGANGPDLVVANKHSDDVAVFLNNGDGTFAPAVAYAAGNGAISVAIGDLDGINGPDLAVTAKGDCQFLGCFGGDTVSVLLNQGDGTFSAAVAYFTGDRPTSVAVADVDGLNGNDLVVANQGQGYFLTIDGSVSVLLNHGDGTFAAAVQYDVGNFPTSLAIGDFDGVDGPDLAVTTGFDCENGGTDTVQVLSNNGDGTFAPAVPYDLGGERFVLSVAIGDLNGINGPDLAVLANYRGRVSVLMNSGDGTFVTAVTYAAGDGPTSVATGDLDGINGLDIAVANSISDDVTIMLNNGDGTFAAAVAYAAGDRPTSVAIEDLDGINGPDLAIANFDSDDVSVLLNSGDGTFAAAVSYAAGDGAALAIDDLDGINGPDLAVANFDSDVVSVLLNNGDGTFAPPVAYIAGDGPLSLAISDLDGINGPDLAVANQDGGDVSVLLNDGEGTFTAAVAYLAGDFPSSVAIDDLDGLNGPDLAVRGLGFPNDLFVLLNQGNGTFAAGVGYATVGSPGSMAIGDMDGINGPDIVLADSESPFACYCTEVHPPNTLVCSGTNAIWVLSNQGDGTFAPLAIPAAGVGPNSVAIADLDGNGSLDLAVANKGSDDVLVLLSRCDPLLVPGEYATIQAAIDAAADGDTVVVADGTYTGTGNRDLDFGGKAITVRSENGADQCIIDIQGAALDRHRAFHFHSGETAASVVQGFTIRNGFTNRGGAVRCSANSSPLFRECVFEQNTASQFAVDDGGGAIFTLGSSPTFIDCEFVQNNVEVNFVFGGGGAVQCQSGSHPNFVGCDFSQNTAFGTQLSDGGAVFVGDGCQAAFSSCTFNANQSDWDAGMVVLGGASLHDCHFRDNAAVNGAAGAYGQYGAPFGSGSSELVSCSFVGNSATGNSGGAAVVQLLGASAAFANCLFADNHTTGNGGGLWVGDEAEATATNCTFTGNSAAGQGGALSVQNSANVSVANSILWNDAPNEVRLLGAALSISYSDIEGGWAGTGNISADPQFVDADGLDGVFGTEDDNLRPAALSPCIDAGDNSALPFDSLDCDGDGNTGERLPCDLDGKSRFIDDVDTPDTGVGPPPVVDMGAYELGPPCATDADCDDGLWCNGVELCVFGSCDVGTPPLSCDDGLACTVDACVEATQSCEHLAGGHRPTAGLADIGFGREMRHLSVQAGDPGTSQTIRVLWDAMPNWPGGHGDLVGQAKFITEPFAVCENSGTGLNDDPVDGCPPAPGLPQAWAWYAQTTCDSSLAWFGDLAALANYCTRKTIPCTSDADCSLLSAGTCGVDHTIHIVDQGIVPSRNLTDQASRYIVQVVGQSCALEDECSYSDALQITQSRFGDAVGGDPGACPQQPPNGLVDLIPDITAALAKFSNLDCAMKKARVDVEPAMPDFTINITDIMQNLLAFQGILYDFDAGSVCPTAAVESSHGH